MRDEPLIPFDIKGVMYICGAVMLVPAKTYGKMIARSDVAAIEREGCRNLAWIRIPQYSVFGLFVQVAPIFGSMVDCRVF